MCYYFVEASTTYGEIYDEDIEEEFNKLQLEINSKRNQFPAKTAVDEDAEISEETDTLCNALSNLHLRKSPDGNQNMSKERGLEAA